MRTGLTHWLVGFVLTAVFLWMLARGLDMWALVRPLSELTLPVLALAVVFLIAAYAVRIVRWWWMLRAFEPSLPVTACAWPLITSVALNNVLFLRGGDAFRVLGFRQQLRSPAVRVLGTLLIERVFDLVVLLGFFFVGLLCLPSGAFPGGVVAAVTWVAGVLLGTMLTLILLTPQLEPLLPYVAHHWFFARRNWSEAIMTQGGHFIGALNLAHSPSRLLVLLGLSVLTWMLEGAVYAIVATSIGVTAISLGPWFAVGTGTLATLIPSTPGYLGTFDYFATRGLEAYGASHEASVAFALTVHAVLWVPLVAAGLLYMFLRGGQFWTRPITRRFS